MKKFIFKDGTVVEASTKEEAKEQHKVIAASKIEFTYNDKKEIQQFFDTLKRCECKIGKKSAACKGKGINFTITRINKLPSARQVDLAYVDVIGKIGENKINIKNEALYIAIRQIKEEINDSKGSLDNLSKTLKNLGFKKTYSEGEWSFEKYHIIIEKVNSKKYYVELRNPLFKDNFEGMNVAPSGIISALSRLAKKLIDKSKENLKMATELNDLVSK